MAAGHVNENALCLREKALELVDTGQFMYRVLSDQACSNTAQCYIFHATCAANKSVASANENTPLTSTDH